MRLSWLLLLFGLAACSSPYSFSKEVTAFSTGVDQVSDGFTSGYAGLAADRAAQVQLDLTEARAEADIAPSCGAPVGTSSQSQAPCALYRHRTAAPTLLGVEQTHDKTMSALNVLKDYAHALAAVTNAADRTAYDAAVAQLSGAVGALAKNADSAAPGLSTIAPAAVNLIGWLVGTALDQQRFDSLKAGVNAVDTPGPNGKKPIYSVTETLGIGLGTLSDARRQVLYDEANVLKSTLGPPLNDATYRQRLSDTQAVIAVLDGLRKSDPKGTVDALAKAHDALVAAVNDPSRNYSNLLKTVGDFADKAAALQTAFAATATPPKAVAKKGT